MNYDMVRMVKVEGRQLHLLAGGDCSAAGDGIPAEKIRGWWVLLFKVPKRPRATLELDVKCPMSGSHGKYWRCVSSSVQNC